MPSCGVKTRLGRTGENCLYPDYHKSVQKSDLSEKFNFLCKQLGANVFWFFTRRSQNLIRTTEWPAVEQRQDQNKVRHIQTIYGDNIICIRRNTDENTDDLKIFPKNFFKIGHLSWHYID